ncbi:hypothetical protein H7X65_02025 [Candidatus Parcubacteria bacterium]|nr:hypothetical protein [Candidatus Parcubacteria bacterium]
MTEYINSYILNKRRIVLPNPKTTMHPLSLPPPIVPEVIVVPETLTRTHCYKTEDGEPEVFNFPGRVSQEYVGRHIPRKGTVFFQYQTVIKKTTFTRGKQTGDPVEELFPLSEKIYLPT